VAENLSTQLIKTQRDGGKRRDYKVYKMTRQCFLRPAPGWLRGNSRGFPSRVQNHEARLRGHVLAQDCGPGFRHFNHANCAQRLRLWKAKVARKIAGLVVVLHQRGQVTMGATLERSDLSARYSQRKTFAESAVQTANTTVNATISPRCADHASPFKIPSSRETA
jgi:hypothetical protein